MKICHLTSAHNRHDIRIFMKECRSLAKAGYSVTLLCADNNPQENNDTVSIISTGFSPKNRLDRLKNAKKAMLHTAISIDADIYHFHDPELLSVGLSLKKKGKIVIYDTHEDVPRQLLSKTWIPRFVRKPVALLFELYENYHARRFDYIITATPHIYDRFVTINPHCSVVNNYPLPEEFDTPAQWASKKNECCYIGCIDVIRGIYQIIDATAITQTHTHFCGTFESETVKDHAMALPGFSYIHYHGQLSRTEVKNVLAQCKIGLILYLPEENHIASQPNKLFEYMATGIPVVASHFPLWKEIVETNECGLCVNPEKPEDIAQAITTLLHDDTRACRMGENGKRAVAEKYNWNVEEKTLLHIYASLTVKYEKISSK